MRCLRALFAVLFLWCCSIAGVTIGQEIAVAPSSDLGRAPTTADELRFWLENMVVHHAYSLDEAAAATKLSINDVKARLNEFDIRRNNIPPTAANRLTVLPYPGGRHPRIGFLDGAVNPQRETKFSVVAPWKDGGYAVVDLPEAIWSNLGLTYLAHTHIDTIWTKANVSLPRLEWARCADGALISQRQLPNGVLFGAKVAAGADGVTMRMWLHNGSNETLSDLRVQNCVMLKGLVDFEQQTNDNKVIRGEYVACHDSNRQRWIITAWQPLHRAWANPPCPCLHSDPRFPDCPPGQTQYLDGWLSFYQGQNLDSELERIESLGWKSQKQHRQQVVTCQVTDQSDAPLNVRIRWWDASATSPPVYPISAVKAASGISDQASLGNSTTIVPGGIFLTELVPGEYHVQIDAGPKFTKQTKVIRVLSAPQHFHWRME